MENEFNDHTIVDVYDLINKGKTISTNSILCVIGIEEFERMYESMPKNSVVISINEPQSKKNIKIFGDKSLSNDILKNFDDYIKTFFLDIEEDFSNYQTISEEEAKKLAQFIIDNKNKQFIIHCAMGHSRSAAVAKALLLWTRNQTLNDKTEIDEHMRYNPNKTVLRSVFYALNKLC